MAYGMQLRDTTGTVTYDSSSQAGVFVEFLTIPTRSTNTEYNVEYPSLIGNNLYVVPIKSGDHAFKVYGPQDIVPGFTSALGYPVIRYKQVTSFLLGVYGIDWSNPSLLMVFAL